ncbi:MAG: hypothetical protein V5A77_08125, partial [Candidatus Bipolaricaulota bacterium]
MSNSIFFNVSANDVKVNENSLDPDEAWKVFRNFPEETDRISLPVISPYLKEFEKVERVYLIFTEGMEKGLRVSLNHGLVIKRQIEKTYGEKNQVNILPFAGCTRNGRCPVNTRLHDLQQRRAISARTRV